MAINKTCQNVFNILSKDLKTKKIKELVDLKVGLENIINNRHVDETGLNINSSTHHKYSIKIKYIISEKIFIDTKNSLKIKEWIDDYERKLK